MWPRLHSLFLRAASLVRNGKSGSARALSCSQDCAASLDNVAVLALVASEQDRSLLKQLGDGHQWSVSFADTCEEAQRVLDRIQVPIVLCDRDLPGRQWWESVQALATSPHRPCILLVSRVADDYLWNEVVRRGGYDVLSKPLRQNEVLRAVKLAWSYWKAL